MVRYLKNQSKTNFSQFNEMFSYPQKKMFDQGKIPLVETPEPFIQQCFKGLSSSYFAQQQHHQNIEAQAKEKKKEKSRSFQKIVKNIGNVYKSVVLPQTNYTTQSPEKFNYIQSARTKYQNYTSYDRNNLHKRLTECEFYKHVLKADDTTQGSKVLSMQKSVKFREPLTTSSSRISLEESLSYTEISDRLNENYKENRKDSGYLSFGDKESFCSKVYKQNEPVLKRILKHPSSSQSQESFLVNSEDPQVDSESGTCRNLSSSFPSFINSKAKVLKSLKEYEKLNSSPFFSKDFGKSGKTCCKDRIFKVNSLNEKRFDFEKRTQDTTEEEKDSLSKIDENVEEQNLHNFGDLFDEFPSSTKVLEEVSENTIILEGLEVTDKPSQEKLDTNDSNDSHSTLQETSLLDTETESCQENLSVDSDNNSKDPSNPSMPQIFHDNLKAFKFMELRVGDDDSKDNRNSEPSIPPNFLEDLQRAEAAFVYENLEASSFLTNGAGGDVPENDKCKAKGAKDFLKNKSEGLDLTYETSLLNSSQSSRTFVLKNVDSVEAAKSKFEAAYVKSIKSLYCSIENIKDTIGYLQTLKVKTMEDIKRQNQNLPKENKDKNNFSLKTECLEILNNENVGVKNIFYHTPIKVDLLNHSIKQQQNKTSQNKSSNKKKANTTPCRKPSQKSISSNVTSPKAPNKSRTKTNITLPAKLNIHPSKAKILRSLLESDMETDQYDIPQIKKLDQKYSNYFHPDYNKCICRKLRKIKEDLPLSSSDFSPRSSKGSIPKDFENILANKINPSKEEQQLISINHLEHSSLSTCAELVKHIQDIIQNLKTKEF